MDEKMEKLSMNDVADGGGVKPVLLGYAEEVDEDDLYRLRYHHYFFEGKVGGHPAWLSFKPLPTTDSLECGICNQPMVFLLQVYAPLNGRPDCFHRTLFLFICRNPNCSLQDSPLNFSAFRSQLPRKNSFYNEEGALDSETNKVLPDDAVDPESVTSLCFVCGCQGSKKCSKCLKLAYCSKTHQALHWKYGHRDRCKKENEETEMSEVEKEFLSKFLFPVYEIVTEEETRKEVKKKERSEEARMAEYKKYLEDSSSKDGDNGKEKMGLGGDDLDCIPKKPDKEFKVFLRRIQENPEQIIRYELGGDPLWATSMSSAEKTPPLCECGSERQFEFQITPHLLSYLGIDEVGKSIDWATVAVFTCKNNCNGDTEGEYRKEWIIKQDFHPDEPL